MQKIIIVGLLSLTLMGCVRKISVEQGNVMKPEMTERVKVGMTMDDVKTIMGSPMLLNTFNDSRVDYVYTFRPGNGTMTEKQMTLTFVNGVLRDIK